MDAPNRLLKPEVNPHPKWFEASLKHDYDTHGLVYILFSRLNKLVLQTEAILSGSTKLVVGKTTP